MYTFLNIRNTETLQPETPPQPETQKRSYNRNNLELLKIQIMIHILNHMVILIVFMSFCLFLVRGGSVSELYLLFLDVTECN